MENEFEKKGIEFRIITEDFIPLVVDFMWKHFYPNAPISRSLGVTKNWFTDNFYLIDAMKDGTSIVAIDKDGRIIGVRLGKRIKRSDWISWIMDRIFSSLPTSVLMYIMPKELHKFPIFFKISRLLDYDVWKMFDKLDCELIYEGKAVCSARDSGVRGLGTELCHRAEQLAKEKGCTHIYAMVTGKSNDQL